VTKQQLKKNVLTEGKVQEIQVWLEVILSISLQFTAQEIGVFWDQNSQFFTTN
jgi:hypothetical protein